MGNPIDSWSAHAHTWSELVQTGPNEPSTWRESAGVAFLDIFWTEAGVDDHFAETGNVKLTKCVVGVFFLQAPSNISSPTFMLWFYFRASASLNLLKK